MAKKRLGRGLDALLGQASSSDDIKTDRKFGSLKRVKIELLRPGQYQPRKIFDKEKLQELADSILAQGLIQPVLVRPSPGGFFEILAGERRVRAAKLAKLNFVPVIVEEITDKKAMSLALIENIQREDLNAVEEATALDRLVKEFGMSHEDVAKSVGRSRASVSNLIRLLGLPASVKAMLDQNLLEMGHARALLGLEVNLIEEYANKIISQSMSVRQIEKIISQLKGGSKSIVLGSLEQKDKDVEILQRKLSEYFHSKVVITISKKGGGKIVIKFSNLDELDGVLERCGQISL